MRLSGDEILKVVVERADEDVDTLSATGLSTAEGCSLIMKRGVQEI